MRLVGPLITIPLRVFEVVTGVIKSNILQDFASFVNLRDAKEMELVIASWPIKKESVLAQLILTRLDLVPKSSPLFHQILLSIYATIYLTPWKSLFKRGWRLWTKQAMAPITRKRSKNPQDFYHLQIGTPMIFHTLYDFQFLSEESGITLFLLI